MNKLTRRQLLAGAAAAGSVLALEPASRLGAAIDAEKIQFKLPDKAMNKRRPLLYGAGMIWAMWLDRSQDYDNRQMDMMKKLGVTVTSLSLDWVDREKVRGQWNWDYPDHAVKEAQKRGLKQFAYVGNTAAWALPDGVDPKNSYRFPPQDKYTDDFRRYCRECSKRYKGKVDMFQFWNEPNGCSWVNDGCSNGHIQDLYTKWAKIAYEALKDGNPECKVAVGALDYNSGVKEGYKYLEGMYKYGIKGSYDAFSIHPYGDPLHWEAVSDTYRVMKDNGDADKELWITEWGYSNSKGEDAADKCREVLTKLASPEYHYVTLANYLCITDLPIKGTEEYGLCDRELNPRPIARAFQECAEGKAQAPTPARQG